MFCVSDNQFERCIVLHNLSLNRESKEVFANQYKSLLKLLLLVNQQSSDIQSVQY